MSESLLSQIPRLKSGSHPDISHGACIMEAVSHIAGEPWSDNPQDAAKLLRKRAIPQPSESDDV
jgi:hypothetical protein